MVELHGELVSAVLVNAGDGLKRSIRTIGSGNELIHQVDRGRIHARQRESCCREKCPQNSLPLRSDAAGSSDRSRHTRRELFKVSATVWSLKTPLKSALPGKVAGSLLGRRHQNRIRRNSLPDAPAFVGCEEESPVFLDRTAESAAKLVLVEFRLVDVQVDPCEFSTLLRKNSYTLP